MYEFILIVHVVICAVLIILVLLQQGKGAEMGAAFGSGASQTIFGSQGSGSFISRLTGILATGFFITSLILGLIALKQHKSDTDLVAPQTQPAVVEKPAASSELPIIPD